MSSPKFDAVNSSCPQKVVLQGPRPAPLMIQNQSHDIKKSPKKPVVIYMVSPKVIHAEASEFMALVQRLTGLSSSSVVEGETSRSCRSFDSHGKKKSSQLPVKVKARTLNRSGSVFVKSSQQPYAQSPTSPTLFFHDLGLPSSGNQKAGAVASQSWFLNGECMYQSPKRSSGDVVGSPGYLDIFNHV